MKKKNLSGRPRLPKGNRKCDVIGFRVSRSERKELTAAAKRNGASEVSEWIRTVLLAAARADMITAVDAEDDGTNRTVVETPA